MPDQLKTFSLTDFIGQIAGARHYIAVGAGVGAILALLLFLTLRPQYHIWMIVAPPRQGAENLNFLVEDLPPVLAPVAAQSTSKNGEYIRFQQSLRGPAVATVLLKMEDMRIGLNRKTTWRWGDGNMLDAGDVSTHLARVVQMDPVGPTESLRLSYRHPDPAFGKKMLRNLVRISDQLIRMDARRDVEARIDWLKRELKQTLNPEHRQALSRLLMAEERRRMMLSIDTPYAVSVIEDATSDPRPVLPRFFFLFPVLVVSGMGAGAIFFHVRRAVRGDE